MELNKEKVEIARARKNITVAQLAEIYGVSRSRINIILNQREVTTTCAGRLAVALGCDVTEIIN